MSDAAVDAKSQNNIESVMLTLRILESLAASHDEKGVTQLARELGSTKARIFRHLQTLRNLGYVVQNPQTEKNSVGARLYVLGQLAGERFNIIGAVRPAMERLRDQVQQTTVFSTILDRQVTILSLLKGANPIEIGLRLGSIFDLHATAQGKIALACGPAAMVDAFLKQKLIRHTPHTVVDPETLRAELETVRRQGWATAPEETLIGINALAAPVMGDAGKLVGALAIVGSIQHIPAHPPRDQVEAVVGAARLASQNVGWRPD
ncbi:MAG TPA: IclR family transcriptional regulator [Alphaproteobacteria bacterium]|jgi:DNA-binding IclR family transcriptional regulator|nr:IclR family transcriptional regulator [Alphaproteobacteria bacterium]